MNRFFSKLDLREIKINPSGSQFPPDGAEGEADLGANDLSPVATAGLDEQAVEPTWDGTAHDGHDDSAGQMRPAERFRAEPELSRHEGVLKVSARSRPSAVAGAIAGVVRERGRAEIQAIGAGATNQAVKAVAIAREYLRESGIDAICVPAFIDVTIDNEDRTAIRMLVEPR
jgi:stage V sporulation protein S